MSCWSKQQDTGRAKTNKKNAYGREQQESQSNPGLRPWRTYSRGALRRWPFQYVQVMITQLCRREKLPWVICSMLSVIDYDYSILQARLAILLVVYFSQVKNKPWLPWVYSWIRHRREHDSIADFPSWKILILRKDFFDTPGRYFQQDFTLYWCTCRIFSTLTSKISSMRGQRSCWA